VYLCVLCGSENKQRLFPYTSLTDWFLYRGFEPLQPSGHYMYRPSGHYMYRPSGHYMYKQFNINQLYLLPVQFIYVFCVDLRTNRDFFPIQS